MVYVLKLSYLGTAFSGFQIQKKGCTVQGEIEKALLKLFQEKVTIHPSGRTDAGVHAFAQVCHFVTDKPFPVKNLKRALNSSLPSSICVTDAFLAPSGFHCRYHAISKTYHYHFYVGQRSPFKEGFSYFVRKDLDFEKMKKAIETLLGVHDFRGFMASGSATKNTIREIFSANLTKSGDDFLFEICGSGFLYNMVRIIVGALVEIGKGSLSENVFLEAFESKERTFLRKTAPACGLYLMNVEYDFDKVKNEAVHSNG